MLVLLIGINCISETKKPALFRVGSILIVHKNRNLVSILQYNAIITYCLLGYFRIPMWSVKTSMWPVSGLREILRFERALRYAAKYNTFFFSLTSKNLSHYFAFSIFLHKFANVNHVRNLIG